jgi:hypothetical protein
MSESQRVEYYASHLLTEMAAAGQLSMVPLVPNPAVASPEEKA